MQRKINILEKREVSNKLKEDLVNPHHDKLNGQMGYQTLPALAVNSIRAGISSCGDKLGNR
jgi:hypothetical protein